MSQRVCKEGGTERLAEEEGEDGVAGALDTEKDKKLCRLDRSLRF